MYLTWLPSPEILSLGEDTVLPLFTYQLTPLPVGSATHRTT
jgi:hypothetical protein